MHFGLYKGLVPTKDKTSEATPHKFEAACFGIYNYTLSAEYKKLEDNWLNHG